MRINILKMGFGVNESISRIFVYLLFVCNEPSSPSIHLFNGSVFSCLCAESCVLLRQEILVALFRTRFLVVWEATASRLPSITTCSHLGRLVSMRLSVVNVGYLILSRFEPGYLYHDIQSMSFFFFIILFTFFSTFYMFIVTRSVAQWLKKHCRNFVTLMGKPSQDDILFLSHCVHCSCLSLAYSENGLFWQACLIL